MQNNSGSQIQKPHPEGKIYDPTGYEKAMGLYTAIIIAGVVFVIFVIFSLMAAESTDSVGFFIFVFVSGIGVIVIMQLCYSSLKREHEENVSREKHRRQVDANDKIVGATKKIDDMSRQMTEMAMAIETAATNTGITIIKGNTAPVIVNSKIIGSFNTIKTSDEDAANALRTLAGFIENSGDKETGEIFNEFHEGLASGEKSPAILASLWEGIVKRLPEIEAMTGIVATITGLFAAL